MWILIQFYLFSYLFHLFLNLKKKLPGDSFTIQFPKFPSNFTGTGDLFAALMLAWTSKSNYDIKSSLEKTISTMQCILKSTLSYAKGMNILKTYSCCITYRHFLLLTCIYLC